MNYDTISLVKIHMNEKLANKINKIFTLILLIVQLGNIQSIIIKSKLHKLYKFFLFIELHDNGIFFF